MNYIIMFALYTAKSVVTTEIYRQDESGNFKTTKSDSIDEDKTYLLQLNSLSECFLLDKSESR